MTDVPPEVASNEVSPGASSTAGVQTSFVGAPLQMAVVAGCNVPGVPPNVIGMAAHRQIEESCMGTTTGCIGEFVTPGDGRADLVRQGLPPLWTKLERSNPAPGLAEIWADSLPLSWPVTWLHMQ
jgi:hypothetical protein